MPTAEEIQRAVWDRSLTTAAGELRAGRVLAQIHNRLDPSRLAVAVAKQLPAVDQAEVKRAVKAALVEIGEAE